MNSVVFSCRWLLLWLSLIAPAKATLVVIKTPSDTDEISRAEIHLYQLGTQKDVWPARNLKRAEIAPGYYRIEVWVPGYRRFIRELEIFGKLREVRAVLAPSAEAIGELLLSGHLSGFKSCHDMWVVAVPLEGNPGDTMESSVNGTCQFRLGTSHAGPYVLMVVLGEKLLATSQVYFGESNADVEINIEGGKPAR